MSTPGAARVRDSRVRGESARGDAGLPEGGPGTGRGDRAREGGTVMKIVLRFICWLIGHDWSLMWLGPHDQFEGRICRTCQHRGYRLEMRDGKLWKVLF